MSGLLTFGLGTGASGLLTFGLGSGALPLGNRDRYVFRAIRDALLDTAAFAEVLLHKAPDQARASAERNPIATVKRTGARETDRTGNPPSRERVVSYTLAIAVRDEDEETRWETMERLQEVALDALEGVCLADITWPFKTVLGRGDDDQKARHPEQRLILQGQFAYEVIDYTRDTAE